MLVFLFVCRLVCYHRKFSIITCHCRWFQRKLCSWFEDCILVYLEFYWKPFNIQLKCGFVIGNIIWLSARLMCVCVCVRIVNSLVWIRRWQLSVYQKTNSLNWTICSCPSMCWFTSKCCNFKYIYICHAKCPMSIVQTLSVRNLFEMNVEAVMSVKRIRIVACYIKHME